MKLLEKIVNKILSDGDYAVGLVLMLFFTLFLFCMTGQCIYREKSETEIKLAKIAAGQMVDVSK